MFYPFSEKRRFLWIDEKGRCLLRHNWIFWIQYGYASGRVRLANRHHRGKKMCGRLASGILNRLGLQRFVCTTNAAYIHLAVELIQNQEMRTMFKERLAQNKAILFNDLEPVRALEDTLIKIVKNNIKYLNAPLYKFLLIFSQTLAIALAAIFIVTIKLELLLEAKVN